MQVVNADRADDVQLKIRPDPYCKGGEFRGRPKSFKNHVLC